MIEELIRLDHQIFDLINQVWTNNLLDFILPYFRFKFFWAPAYLFFISFLILNYRMQGVVVVVLIILTIAVSDQLASSIIKPLVGRFRPCQLAEMRDHVRLLVHCGSGFSFPSSHAANHFTLSTTLSVLLASRFRWVLPVTILWALTVSYAQVYVGVHFPIDVLAGSLLGIIIGLIAGSSIKNLTKFSP